MKIRNGVEVEMSKDEIKAFKLMRTPRLDILKHNKKKELKIARDKHKKDNGYYNEQINMNKLNLLNGYVEQDKLDYITFINNVIEIYDNAKKDIINAESPKQLDDVSINFKG